MNPQIRVAIASIDETTWTTIDYPDAVYDELVSSQPHRHTRVHLPFHHHGATALGRERTGRTRDKSSTSRAAFFPRRINRYAAATIDNVTCRYHARYTRTW